MSASEKLKALEETIQEHDRIRADVDEYGDLREPMPSVLLVGAFRARMDLLPAALPQIRAVVEAAERAVENIEGDIYLEAVDSLPVGKMIASIVDEKNLVHAALAALDQALSV